MQPAIRVENLSKLYQIAASQDRGYRTLRESLTGALAAPWHRLRRHLAQTEEAESEQTTHWALKDVSFVVHPGEAVGIVGRNGAGKSTLLKILTRITEPTSGRGEFRGRIASLLEVGTGFHPELSGRENVFLNGALLGMTRREITRKFDAIVAFSEIDKFLDTPVKRYSSGMYIRLAFAVAAHLESEILLVDEVLAVGDVGFQQKCLGKMGDVAKMGRTVLFVSHNMPAITMLCNRALLMDNGHLAKEGSPVAVVESYLGAKGNQMAEKVWEPGKEPGNDIVKLRAVRVLNDQGQVSVDHDITKPIDVELDFDVLKPGSIIAASIHVLSAQGHCLFVEGTHRTKMGNQPAEVGAYRATCKMPADFFNEGKNYVSVFIMRDKTVIAAAAREAVSFIGYDYGAGRYGYSGSAIPGAVRPCFPWDVQRLT